MENTPLGSTICYSGSSASVSWEGREVLDAARFSYFIKERVRERVDDDASDFESQIRALTTTEMDPQFISRFLKATPAPQAWEIGEAFAEVALQCDCGNEILWPWNTVRDRRTPRASLPGADLVGFFRDGEDVLLLFGEVKTSSDRQVPPNVMYGGSGMTWQLESSATQLDVQHSLLRWLSARCYDEPFSTLFKKAVSRYLQSEGREMLLVGVLLRDTPPNEQDVRSRANYLARTLESPTQVNLFAWYLPLTIEGWPDLLEGEAS